MCFFWPWKRIREEGLYLHESPLVVLTHYEPFRASMLLPGGYFFGRPILDALCLDFRPQGIRKALATDGRACAGGLCSF